jgi:polyphosphate kinase
VPHTQAHDAAMRYINRGLSWLDFNGRVLDLAADSSVPLLERIKFCSPDCTQG